jgi:hypothetical protein
MDARSSVLTVITPTVGRPGLERLVRSLDSQTLGPRIYHIVLWDDQRWPQSRAPEQYAGPRRLSLTLSAGFGRNDSAPGSPLRAIGLLAAATPWVTFADDDVVWDTEHASTLLAAAEGRNWASCLRRIVSPAGEALGMDEFESVGDDPGRRVSYEMCDGNTMVFRRELGVAAAPLYRETTDYDDDRRLYALLKMHGGRRGRTGRATIQQICPERLVPFYRANCTPLPGRQNVQNSGSPVIGDLAV